MAPQPAVLETRPASPLWSFVRGLIDRLALIAAVLGAGTVPSFIAQYRQRVGGMLAQAQADLASFLDIARRFHGGDLEKLIAHHRASTDPTFKAEAEAIAALRDAADRLRDAYGALDTDLVGQLAYLARNVDPSIASATWEIFEPAFSFSPANLVFALAVGLVLWLAFALFWGLFAALFTRRR